MKIAVVGGGSTYTPELVDGFARRQDSLPLDTLVLVDPAEDRLDVVAGLARRIFARQGHPGTITSTTDLDAAVADADAVLLQFRVGGQAARQRDETWPLECGCIGQETTGAGGLAKALRTVPVALDVASRVKRANPEAWIVDFTNPVGIVTRALLTAGHRAVGLCNVAIGFQRRFAAMLGVDPSHITLDHVGLNHLTWERAVWLDGVDVLPKLIADHADEIADDLELPVALLERLGVVPSYYLRYFYAHDEVLREQQVGPSRASQVAAIESELLRMYADETLDEKPAELMQRGGAFYSEAAVALATSLLVSRGAAGGDRQDDVQVVNTLNAGTLAFLPDDAVIEVPAHVDVRGVTPVRVEELEPLYAGLVAHVTAYEQLALDAALRGGYDRVFKALLAHPLVGQDDQATGLADRLIAENRHYLAWA
jgi:6-phospho-beta-glucosidase